MLSLNVSTPGDVVFDDALLGPEGDGATDELPRSCISGECLRISGSAPAVLAKLAGSTLGARALFAVLRTVTVGVVAQCRPLSLHLGHPFGSG